MQLSFVEQMSRLQQLAESFQGYPFLQPLLLSRFIESLQLLLKHSAQLTWSLYEATRSLNIASFIGSAILKHCDNCNLFERVCYESECVQRELLKQRSACKGWTFFTDELMERAGVSRDVLMLPFMRLLKYQEVLSTMLQVEDTKELRNASRAVSFLVKAVKDHFELQEGRMRWYEVAKELELCQDAYMRTGVERSVHMEALLSDQTHLLLLDDAIVRLRRCKFRWHQIVWVPLNDVLEAHGITDEKFCIKMKDKTRQEFELSPLIRVAYVWVAEINKLKVRSRAHSVHFEHGTKSVLLDFTRSNSAPSCASFANERLRASILPDSGLGSMTSIEQLTERAGTDASCKLQPLFAKPVVPSPPRLPLKKYFNDPRSRRFKRRMI